MEHKILVGHRPECGSPIALLPIALLGAGSIAQALVRGLLQAGVARPGDIRVTNRSDRVRLERVAQTYGVRPASDKAAALAGAKTVILATKPADAATCLEECRPHLERMRAWPWRTAEGDAGAAATAEGDAGAAATAGRVSAASPLPLVISVAAGLTTAFVESLLPPGTPVVRAMPNTSCAVGESATALAAGRSATAEHVEVARSVFAAVGDVVVLEEGLMDAITGLSGSGPAYVYLMLEAMTEAGVNLGLDPETAGRLSLQTLRGAVATALATGEDPRELRRRVTSPGGTTMAGLKVLEDAGFKEGLIGAVRRAAERSAEMAAAEAARSKRRQA